MESGSLLNDGQMVPPDVLRRAEPSARSSELSTDKMRQSQNIRKPRTAKKDAVRRQTEPRDEVEKTRGDVVDAPDENPESQDVEPQEGSSDDAPPESQESAGEPEADDDAEPGESFGIWLRRQREIRDISLREIADTSKISLRYLEAFEDERFDILPAPIFAKGFLREYARYVGLDAEETVNFFITASNAGDQEPEVMQPQSRGGGRVYLLVAIIAILLLGTIWGMGELQKKHASERASDAPTEEPANAPPGTKPADTGAAGMGTAGTGGASADPAGATATNTNPETAEPAQAVPEIEAPPIAVNLDFRGECWISTVVDGEQGISETKVQGESLRLEAMEGISLILGNARVVDLELNGVRYELDDSRARQELSIDADNVRLVTATQGPLSTAPAEGN